uniref:flagellar attachment zone protein 1-like isoform X1 n=1 Tax=Myxine glutinosa TaxID=7769 RepID=UPI00358E7C5D
MDNLTIIHQMSVCPFVSRYHKTAEPIATKFWKLLEQQKTAKETISIQSNEKAREKVCYLSGRVKQLESDLQRVSEEEIKMKKKLNQTQKEHRQKVDENKYFHQQLELKQKKEEELSKKFEQQVLKNADLQNILPVQISENEKLKHNIALQIKMLEETEMERIKLKH